MFPLFLTIFASQFLFREAYVITVYGDVNTDTYFFTNTFPWIIDNIGGDIAVEYYMVGSGRYGVPQMCALEALKLNTFLQAQYLKCEAEGNPSESCLCDSGIDPVEFKNCVATKGHLASVASEKFAHLGIEATPIIELGYKSTIFGVDDIWYLKKICTIFGDNLPRGCIKPFACNNQNSTVQCCDKKAIAHFDNYCRAQCSKGCFEEPKVTTTTPIEPTFTDIYDTTSWEHDEEPADWPFPEA